MQGTNLSSKHFSYTSLLRAYSAKPAKCKFPLLSHPTCQTEVKVVRCKPIVNTGNKPNPFWYMKNDLLRGG